VLAKAVVLGSGPAGLLTAHALKRCRYFSYVQIYSLGIKSPMYGAQYLHEPIPGLDLPNPITVAQRLMGTPEQYGRKVHGAKYDPNMPHANQYDGNREAWDIRAAYEMLWREYARGIRRIDLSREKSAMVADLVSEPGTWVFNTVPRWRLCKDPRHNFLDTKIWAIGDAPERGFKLDFTAENNTITCNGLIYPSWYRLSRIYGRTTVEWPSIGQKPPIPGIVRVSKPISTDCDCWPKIYHLGRYGEWKKGVLAHEAYFKARVRAEELAAMGVLG
jgi:hypothetical protein